MHSNNTSLKKHHQSKLDERDTALGNLETRAWRLDDEAAGLNDVSIGLSVASGVLMTWSLFDLLTRPPEPNLIESTQVQVSPAGLRVSF